MIDLDNNKWIRRIFGNGKSWRIFWRFDESSKRDWKFKLKFTFVLHRVPFVLLIAIPALFGLGFTLYENGANFLAENNNMMKYLLMQLCTFSWMFAVVVYNEWYGTQKGYDYKYHGQMLSGGTRTIIDGLLSEKWVLTCAWFWFLLGLVSFAGLWVLAEFNLILLAIFVYGAFALIFHDWFKGHGHWNLLGYYGMTIAPLHGTYVALTGTFPPLELWVYSLIELLFVYEAAGFVDLADLKSDAVTGKKTVYVRHGIDMGWLSYRTLAFSGAILLAVGILVGMFPIWWLLRLIFWLFTLPVWAIVDRHAQDNLAWKVEIPFFLIVGVLFPTWFIWVFLMIFM